MNTRIRRQLAARNRRIVRRVDKTRFGRHCPAIATADIHYEIADRTQAIAAGGIGVVQHMVRRLDLDGHLNRGLNIFKISLPYSKSDQVLNIAHNLLAGGTCLDHLELRRQDEAYLNALGAQRIPDPTTAGDSCRRFTTMQVNRLMELFNETRLKVWKRQPDEFFAEAGTAGPGEEASGPLTLIEL